MAKSKVPEVFFVSFWCFVSVIMINVFVALVIEIYTSVQPKVSRKTKQIDLTLELKKIVDSVDRETLVERITEVKK